MSQPKPAFSSQCLTSSQDNFSLQAKWAEFFALAQRSIIIFRPHWIVEGLPMEHPPLEANLTVAEVLARWPQTIPVFIHHRMACVGCVMAPFETLAEVARIYNLELDSFLRELEQSIPQLEK